MSAARIGLWAGIAGFVLTLVIPAPFGMPAKAWPALGLVWWMAAWWMTEALPLSATALLPFIVLPLTGIADANKTAAGHAGANLGLVRRVAASLLKQDTGKGSIKAKRLSAALDENYLMRVLRGFTAN